MIRVVSCDARGNTVLLDAPNAEEERKQKAEGRELIVFRLLPSAY